MTDHVTIEDLPLLGRVGRQDPVDPTYQVFGRIAADSGDIPGTLLDQRTAVRAAGKVKGCRNTGLRMRRIRSSGIQVTRDENAGGVPPLDRAAIIPPVDGSNRTPSFSLLIDAATAEGYTTFRMDVGETLDLVCAQINVTVCGPDAQLVAVGPVDDRRGLVADATIGISVYDIESVDGGHRRVTFSELIRIPQGVALDIPIPSFAAACKVYMGPTLAAGGVWRGFASDGNFAQQCIVDFDATGAFSLDETSQLGGAAFLQTDIDQANDRYCSIVWQIEP